MGPLPKVLRNYNVLVDGTTFAGIATEVTLPKLAIKEEEHRGGGHDMPIPIDMGMEKVETGFTLAEHHAAVFRKFGLRDGQSCSLVFRGAKVDDKSVESYVVEVRGRLREIEPGNATPGGKNEFKGMVSCRYIKITMKGETLIEIDADNFKRVIGGQDVLADIRAAIA